MLRVTVSFLLAVGLPFGSVAKAQVPAPAEVLGFEPGDDYQLALWGELIPYYEALAAASDRVELREIGETVLGEPLLVLFISSPENLAALDRHRENARALAHAEIPEDEAIRISREGKAVVWIDAGLHATEVAPAQMAPLLAHRIATEESEEVRKIRDEVILILMPCMNPDGLDIVASWYRRNLRTPFETTRPPELYHHYVGHDNNRDWFMNNMPETAAVSRMLYHEWFPQIVYNHHQSGPALGADLPAAVRRPGESQDPSRGHHLGEPDRFGDGEPLRHEEDAGRGVRHDLFDVVERGHADGALFPQHDRPLDRDVARFGESADVRPGGPSGVRRQSPPRPGGADQRNRRLLSLSLAGRRVTLLRSGPLLADRVHGGSRRGGRPPGKVALRHLEDGP